MRLRRAFFTAALVLVLAAPSLAQQGTPWNINIQSGADADGGMVQVAVTLQGPGLPDNPVQIGKLIAGGATAAEKCQQIAAQLNKSKHLDASCPAGGTKIKVQVSAGSPYNDIKGIEVDESKTGEKITEIKDDPIAADPMMTVYFEIFGDSTEGEAVLGVGEGPLASVRTDGLPDFMIAEELAVEFNLLYADLGYVAQVADSMVYVDGVPCPEGVRAGTDDSNLDFAVGMTRP